MPLATASRPGASTPPPTPAPCAPPLVLPAVPATVSQDLLVPTADGVVDYANLDHAASTPALVSVKNAVDRALRTYSSVHRGNGFASRVTSRWYEEARTEVARFAGARPGPDGDVVVFTRTTTDSWAVLANALPTDTTVIVFAAEHHSTLLPWGPERTVTLPVPSSADDAVTRLDDALAALTSSHRLVVVTGASNVTGEIWPIDRLVEVAARHGARFALDAAQLAPHRRIDLAGSGIDYVAFSGHKLYAPFGAGALVGRADWLDVATPYLIGGGATAQVSDAGGAPEAQWATGAARHEGGSPNVIGAIALAAACSTLSSHRAAIEAHEDGLATRLRTGFAAIPGVRCHSLFAPDHDRVAVLAFTVDGVPSSLVSTALSVEHGIGVRDGKFCAHLLVDHLLDGQGSATAVRASIGLATTAEHVERLIAAVAALAAHGPRLAYTEGAQGWAPQEDPREVELVRPW